MTSNGPSVKDGTDRKGGPSFDDVELALRAFSGDIGAAAQFESLMSEHARRAEAALRAIHADFTHDSRIRGAAASGLVRLATDPAMALEALLADEPDPFVRQEAIDSLARRAPAAAVPHLIALLAQWDPPVRAFAARTLQWIVEGRAGSGSAEAPVVLSAEQITAVWKAFLWTWDEAVTLPLSLVLAAQHDPDRKLTLLLDLLVREDVPIVREGFDERCAGVGVGATDPATQLSAIGAIASKCLGDGLDGRIVEVLAGLAVGVTGGSRRAGRLLDGWARENTIPEPALRRLRVEIGGETAMAPIMGALEESVAKPLADLRRTSRDDWNGTTKAARIGFAIRIGMSILVFATGLVVTIAAAWKAVGTESAEQLFGPGVTLAAGLGAMLTVVFKEPLTVIRASVHDLAKANIGFMTFMHELHYFTAVFGSDYAHGTLTYDQLTRGVELLDTSAAHAITAITQPTDEGTAGTAKKPARARQ